MVTDEHTPTTDEVADAYTQWRVRQRGITDPDQRILASIDALTEFERWQATQRTDAEVADRIAQAIKALPDVSIPGYFGTRPGGYVTRTLAATTAREVGRSASTLHDAPPQDDDGLPPYRPVQRFGADGGRLLPARVLHDPTGSVDTHTDTPGEDT